VTESALIAADSLTLIKEKLLTTKLALLNVALLYSFKLKMISQLQKKERNYISMIFLLLLVQKEKNYSKKMISLQELHSNYFKRMIFLLDLEDLPELKDKLYLKKTQFPHKV
jgi:hypothetical protein